MADLFDKIHADEIIVRAKEATEVGMYPYFRALSHSEGVTATFEGKEVVMLGSNNYLGLTTDSRVKQAAVGAISAIAGPGDYVILDKDDHASIVDGVTMSQAEMKRFRHNSLDSLENVLAKLPEEAGKLVIVDGVYSMGGDIAPLPEIVAISKKYGARIMVDDAHGIGVTGNGRGTAVHFGMTDQIDLMMGTFSKSFASIGGFIAGSAEVMYYIQHKA